jgi:hypothetical protein
MHRVELKPAHGPWRMGEVGTSAVTRRLAALPASRGGALTVGEPVP